MNAKAFYKNNLAIQYMFLSLPIFLVGAILVGSWVSLKIENGIAARLGGVAGLYVESFVARHLQHLGQHRDLDEHDIESLEMLMAETPLGQKIDAFKVWDRSGRVVFSQDKSIMGKTFPIDEGLTDALKGNIHSEISWKPHGGKRGENGAAKPLFETYVPIRDVESGKVIGVAEFYQSTDEVLVEMRKARRQSWYVVVSVFAVSYLLLSGLVKKGSNTIQQQREMMEQQVIQLTKLNQQNSDLSERIRRAATRTTESNENVLKRIAADLHDGPVQDLALGLMKMETIGIAHGDQPESGTVIDARDFESISHLMKDALTEIRQICLGIILPELANLPASTVVARALRDYQTKTGVTVEFTPLVPDVEIAMPAKISLYRIVQESLSNGFKHAGGRKQSVTVSNLQDAIRIRITDQGKGFNPESVWNESHLGLKGMRERVEVLGGTFAVQSNPTSGTTITVTIPMHLPGGEYD